MLSVMLVFLEVIFQKRLGAGTLQGVLFELFVYTKAAASQAINKFQALVASLTGIYKGWILLC